MSSTLLLEWISDDSKSTDSDSSSINWLYNGQCLKIEKLGSDNSENTICCYAMKCSNKNCDRIHLKKIDDYRNLQNYLSEKLSGTKGNPNQWIPTKVFKDLKNLEKQQDRGRTSVKVSSNSDDYGFDRSTFKKNITKRTPSAHSDLSISSKTTTHSDTSGSPLSQTCGLDIVATIIQLSENNTEMKKMCIKHLQNLGEEIVLSKDANVKSSAQIGLQLYKTMAEW